VLGSCVAWPYVAPRLDIPASYRVSPFTHALGASGAINGVITWSILMFPTRSIYIYMILPIPAVGR
jgi:membrane associated rhomboid family serine protease